MTIEKITEEQRNLLKRQSVYALSTRPAEQGKKEADVKAAMFEPVETLCDIIDQKLEGINNDFQRVDAETANMKPTVYPQDSLTTQIDYTLANNEIKVFKETAQSVKLTIPKDIEAGYCAGVAFFTGDEPPQINLESNGKRLNLIQYGGSVGVYNASQNVRVTMHAYSNDGVYVDLFIVEASK